MKHHLILLIIGIIFIALFILVEETYVQSNTIPPTLTPVTQTVTPSQQTTPVAIITPEKIQDIHVDSADGKMTITMKTDTNNQTMNTYSFFVSNIGQGKQQLLLTKTLPISDTMTVPDNSWSPDDRYLFLQEQDATTASVFVFHAMGEPFSDGKQFIDVTSLFNLKITQYILKDITGWDSSSLLHIRTVTDQNATGPSYWFDIYSQSFTKLGTK